MIPLPVLWTKLLFGLDFGFIKPRIMGVIRREVKSYLMPASASTSASCLFERLASASTLPSCLILTCLLGPGHVQFQNLRLCDSAATKLHGYPLNTILECCNKYSPISTTDRIGSFLGQSDVLSFSSYVFELFLTAGFGFGLGFAFLILVSTLRRVIVMVSAWKS